MSQLAQRRSIFFAYEFPILGVKKEMIPSILAIGKAIPPYSLSQLELAALLSDLMQLSDEESWILERIYKNSAIDRRFSVLSDFMQAKNRYQGGRVVGMSERNELYKREAPILAENAARNAFQQWGGSLNEITHVISVSCTGLISPGIEYFLARQFDLAPDVSLLGVNFMGCFGTFKALKVASKIAKDNPKNRVLLVSTELCSLHFKPYGDIESIVIQSLFADGSAAVIIGSEPEGHERALFNIIDEKSYFIKNTMDEMTWNASDEGFDMKLSQRVPSLINEHIFQFATQFIDPLIKLDQYEWAIHPGGKSIIEAIEKSLSLDRSQTISSWNILQHFGNLSSATFLYVLEDIQNRRDSKEHVIGLGFGPGLSIEGLKLQQISCSRG